STRAADTAGWGRQATLSGSRETACTWRYWERVCSSSRWPGEHRRRWGGSLFLSEPDWSATKTSTCAKHWLGGPRAVVARRPSFAAVPRQLNRVRGRLGRRLGR